MVIPCQPDQTSQINTEGPFFTLQSGENLTKVDLNINDNPNRRLLGFSSNKVMRTGIRMSNNGVMDATFKV